MTVKTLVLVAIALAALPAQAASSRTAAKRLAVQAAKQGPAFGIQEIDGHHVVRSGGPTSITVASPRSPRGAKPVRSFTLDGALRTSYGNLAGDQRYAYSARTGLFARMLKDGTVSIQRVKWGFSPQVVVKDWTAAQILLYPDR